MCSVRFASRMPVRHATVLATVLVCAATSGLSAQDAEQYRAKVVRLAAHLEAVRAQVLAVESIPVGLDTVRMGPIQLLVRPDRRPLLTDVAAATWDSLVAELGADTALIPESRVLVQFAGDDRLRVPSEVGQYLVRFRGDTKEVADDLTRFFMLAMWDGLGEDLNRWIRSPSLFGPLTDIQAEVVYVELATAPWEAVKLCRASDLEACGRVLGLEAADDTVSLWYTAEEQRRAVEQSGGSWWMSVRTSPDYTGCLDGDAAACSAFLNEHRWIIGEPLSATARESLLRVALEVGGDGALGRLASSGTRSMGARLSAAAEIPRDSLIALWRERILAAAPAQVILTGATGGTALVWVLLMTFLALRSTRWRDP